MNNDDYFPKEYDHEDVFDTMILPMLKTIVNICDEHDIPMVASFQFAVEGTEARLCTSVILPTERANEQIAQAAKILTTPS